MLNMRLPYFFSSVFEDSSIFEVTLKDDNWINSLLSRITKWTALVSYWLSFGIYVILTSLLILLGAFVIFLSTSLSSYTTLKVFISVFVLTSLWPVFWYGINIALSQILLTENAFSNNIFLILGSFLKIVFPLYFLSLILKAPLQNKISSAVKLSSASGLAALNLVRFSKHMGSQALSLLAGDRHTNQASGAFHKAGSRLKKEAFHTYQSLKTDISHKYNLKPQNLGSRSKDSCHYDRPMPSSSSNKTPANSHHFKEREASFSKVSSFREPQRDKPLTGFQKEPQAPHSFHRHQKFYKRKEKKMKLLLRLMKDEFVFYALILCLIFWSFFSSLHWAFQKNEAVVVEKDERGLLRVLGKEDKGFKC